MIIIKRRKIDIKQKDINYREKLKKIKQGYEFINEIITNYENIKLNIKNETQLENVKELLKELYETTYLKAYKNDTLKVELITNDNCPDCNNNLLISDVIDYSYVCLDCDKNLYNFEVNIDKNWYEEDLKQNKISSSFYLEKSEEHNINQEISKNNLMEL